MRVYLKEPKAGGPTAMIGKYGQQSWAAQAPADPDLYLQEIFEADEEGQISEDALARGSVGGMWIEGDQIARIETLRPDEPTEDA